MGETIYGQDGYEYELVDEPEEIYDEATGEWYEVVDPEADFDQQLAERAENYEAFLDRLDNIVAAAEKHKGRSFTEREVNVVLSQYLSGEPDEHGRGDIGAAAEAVRNLSDLDDRNERRAFMAERLQEEERAQGDPIYSSLDDQVPEPVQAGEEGGDYDEDDE